MARLLTRSIGTKVSEEDYELLRDVAGDRKLGDWVREVVLRAALVEPAAAAHRTILGEVLALRKILLNLQFAAATGEPVTRERMLGWIAEADADKTEKASARLSAAE
jgi:voltage-gated potassium channel Kch